MILNSNSLTRWYFDNGVISFVIWDMLIDNPDSELDLF